MNKIKTIMITASLAVAILTTIVVATFRQGLTTTDSVTNIGCISLADVQLAMPHSKVPTYLPTGYMYQCGIAEAGESNMVFWNQTVDRLKYKVDPISSAYDSPGSILIRTTDRPDIKNSTAEADSEYKYIAENNAKLNVQLIQINGNPAWANDISSSAGTQHAKFPDGQVISNTFDMPARIRIFENGQTVHIEGFVPLGDLIKVAESLK